MSRVFNPREYQQQAIRFLVENDRANLFASPGMGKTCATLTALEAACLLRDAYPVLVVAPHRVANGVWTRETSKWAHLKHLRVSKILGTAAERIAALRAKADIYTINYENLSWLEEQLGGKMPFKTVVADESTRLKNHRCSLQVSKLGKRFFRKAGAKNASALARMSFAYDNHTNLTGTPAPNGLQDLWGQQFFVDHGEQLGRSYTAFTDRWFRIRPGSSREAAVFEPLKHAEAEITERLKASTLSLDAYDWFDVERPREVDIEIELTDRLMKDYRTLHNDAVLQLTEDTTVTAVNAAVITAKCLQFATGILHDSDSVVHPIHDLKLQALESLMENLCGAPLLVAYHWKATAESILRRFKGKAEVLPKGAKQKDCEDRWNRGEIPMLLVHPQSAGHGLDLQHGGHNLCIFSPQWDLELYQQVIERIGPVRQAQAGYDRLVNVYRLITKGTFDEVVIKRIDTKCTVQQAVMQAVRA